MYDAEKWLEHYAPGYDRLAPAERQALSEFVLLWSLFEGQVLACNATVDLMFEAIDHWHAGWALDQDRVREPWNHFVGRYSADGRVTNSFHGLRLNREDHRKFLEAALLAEAPDAPQRHKALALIVYRLRNNLLHGEKWLYELVDQERNFRAAAHVLMVWMDLNKGR